MKTFYFMLLFTAFLASSSHALARNFDFSSKKSEWNDKAEKIKDKAKDHKSKWESKANDKWKDKWKDKGKNTGSKYKSSNDDDKKYVRYFNCRYIGPGNWFSRSYFSVTDKNKERAFSRSKQRCENRQGSPFTIEVCEQITCVEDGRYE